jgi:hypothetical protein
LFSFACVLLLCIKNVTIEIKMKILLFILLFMFFFNINLDIEIYTYNHIIKTIFPVILLSAPCLSRMAWIIEDFWGNYLKLMMYGDLLYSNNTRLISR